MRDNNRQNFYNFEQKMLNIYLPNQLNDGLSLTESQELVQKICRSYGVLVPDVKQGRSNRIAYYRASNHTIVLPPWAQRSWVVLHEVAHALTRGSTPAHGREFIEQWCELWSRMYSLNKSELLKEANKSGLI